MRVCTTALLKGPTTARWLHGLHGLHRDVDVLVRVADLQKVDAALTAEALEEP